jgi:hypothetical protein
MGDRAAREQLFGWVYENNQWGVSDEGAKYNSDSPSHRTVPYRNYLSRFLAEHADVRKVVDLACGDYRVSRETDLGNVHYLGVDIYDRLIDHNKALYGDEHHEFQVRDLVEDDLPSGDLGLMSMVLYLMSHADVRAILPKLRQYRYVLITDGQPDIPVSERRNLDKRTDKYTPRDVHNNGFYLELPPFSLDLEVVLEYQIPGGEIIRTILIEHPEAVLPEQGPQRRRPETTNPC